MIFRFFLEAAIICAYEHADSTLAWTEESSASLVPALVPQDPVALSSLPVEEFLLTIPTVFLPF